MTTYFGKVDGAAESASGFVRFESTRWGDISLQPNDRKVRVLVGRRGSGKSRYLRAIERDASHSEVNRMLVFPQRDQKIWITQMRWLHRAYPETHERIEAWDKLWGCAIYASIASYLVNFKNPVGTSTNLRLDERDYLAKFCKDQLGSSTVCVPIVYALNHFIKRYQDKSRLESFCAEPFWIEIEDRVLKAISDATPIACYVDTLDDTFAASPAASTDCQVGLLEWILRKALDTHVSNRVHVVVAVRDTVYAALMQTEHAQRYSGDGIRCLDWSRSAADYFLREKIKLLPSEARIGQDQKSDPIKGWLGTSTIQNPVRGGVEEAIADLIVRHTRFLPREIIAIGNDISQYIVAQKETGEAANTDVISDLIMARAHSSSEEALDTVADHMIAMDGDHDRTVISDGFRERVRRAIQDTFINKLKDERFRREVLDDAEAAFVDELGGWRPSADWRLSSLGEVLWLHGLIGYEDETGFSPIVKYFSSSRDLNSDTSGRLPKANYYYLHSSLLKPTKMGIEAKPPVVGVAADDD